MVTVIHEGRQTDLVGARAAGDTLWVSAADAERATGWSLKVEGLCREDSCIPIPHGRASEFVRGGVLDVAAFWRHAGHPVVRDDTGEVWVLGTGAGARASSLRSLRAPHFALPDLSGRVHTLAEYRGRKVLLVTWASW